MGLERLQPRQWRYRCVAPMDPRASSAAEPSGEVWPGSHRLTTNDDHVHDPKMNLWIKEQLVKERARMHPPVQVECKVGGVFLRDMRLWHAGE
jgi:ectoine hydroxylase-related dioxygenase (phytanoyl-CoA dioxygenase family)